MASECKRPADKTCAYCGAPSEGNFSIHRDGFCEGPEVWLCDAHGGGELPSCPRIWAVIEQNMLPDTAYCGGPDAR